MVVEKSFKRLGKNILVGLPLKMLACSMHESPYPINVMFPKSRITKAKQLIMYPCSA